MIWIGPLDIPSEARKQHSAPTPTSGGVGIGVGYGAAMLVFALYSSTWRHDLKAEGVDFLLASPLLAYPLLVVGFVDDLRYLRARFKFVIYAVIAFAAAWLLGVVGELRVGEGTLTLPYIVALGGTALWVFTLINAVNFMDGSNGLAMGSVAIGLIGACIIALEGGFIAPAASALCAAGALVGFLVWNFPSGRLFAGDSGALFAGALAAFTCIFMISQMGMSVFIAPILFFPLLADVLLTLLHRARRRQSLLLAHNDHIYQLAIRAGWSHARTAVVYWLAMLVCGAIAIVVSHDTSHLAAPIALALLAVASLAIDHTVRQGAKLRALTLSEP
jgi:UDP-N-acetylmuramyl pentapeptide phosphotransferase/UDP-N-acetylglucosamine-1-phosphate transferase